MKNTSLKKILIIAKEDTLRESLKSALNNFYNLILTNSGEQALDCLKHDKTIALIFLDLKTPKINSDEFLKTAKEINTTIKILFVLGNNSFELTKEEPPAGSDGYIIKPFKSAEILNTVKTLLK